MPKRRRRPPKPEIGERIADNPDVRPVEREISRHNNAIDKVVVLDTLRPEHTAPWHNTTIVPRAEAVERVAEFKREPGGDILVFGSHTLWNHLLSAALVDELHLMIGAGCWVTGRRSLTANPRRSELQDVSEDQHATLSARQVL